MKRIILLLSLLVLAGCWNNDRTMPGDAPPVLKRYCLTLDLKRDSASIANYLLWHSADSLWEEIPEGMQEVGIQDLQTYRQEGKLCLIVETPTDFDWNARMTELAALPRQSEWNDLLMPSYDGVSGSMLRDVWRPMERIFTLRNSRQSTAGDGYPLAALQSDAKRYCQSLDLVKNPRLIEEYKRWHKRENIWKEITEGMKAVGILDLEIYLVDTRLYMIVDVPGEFDWETRMETLSSLTRQKEWSAFTSKFHRIDPVTKQRDTWTMMERIFQLTDFR